MDKDLEQSYNNEARLGVLINYFAIIAIFIACMGLFGLATYAAEKRVKEVGIRKVLGASVSSIVKLLSSDFTKLILIANIIAWPFAFYTMNYWLRQFAFSIDLSVEAFLIASLVTFILALVTVGFHAVKAALSNPVDTLKYE